MKFKELKKGQTSDIENEYSKYWKDENIFEKSITSREGKENFVFYDGPIYANAKPGIHHVFAKTIKDAEDETNLKINSAYVTIPGKNRS